MKKEVDMVEILESFRYKSLKDIIKFVQKLDTEIVQDFRFTEDLVLTIIATMKSDFNNNDDKLEFIEKIKKLIL